MADKPGEADEAVADEADKAKANEANDNEAIVTDAANKANVAKEANVIDKIVATDEAIDTNEADEADESNSTNKANEVNEANDTIMADKADELDELDEADEAGIVSKADVANLLLPFSLTNVLHSSPKIRYIFGMCVDVRNNKLLVARSQDELDKFIEVEGANNNQLQGCSLSSLITWNRVIDNNQPSVTFRNVLFSLRIWNLN